MDVAGLQCVVTGSCLLSLFNDNADLFKYTVYNKELKGLCDTVYVCAEYST